MKKIDQKLIDKIIKENNLKFNEETKLYDCDDSVYINYLNLSKIPIPFGSVKGNFDCSHNKLTTLKNAPKKVGGYFSCSCNKLKSLKGCPCPESPYWGLNCANNQLTSLKYAPINFNNLRYGKCGLPDSIMEIYKKSVKSKQWTEDGWETNEGIIDELKILLNVDNDDIRGILYSTLLNKINLPKKLKYLKDSNISNYASII